MEPERAIGELLIERGLITAGQLDAALAEQARLADQGIRMFLGQILVRDRVLSASQFVDVMRDQDRVMMTCDACAVRYNIHDYDLHRRYRCKRCGQLLRMGRDTTLEVSSDVAVSDPVTRAFRPKPKGELVFGRYRDLTEIGHGGMGRVYQAHDTRLDRRVALKVMQTPPGETPVQAERFLREAQIAARLSHPHIIPVFDMGVDGDLAYYTMELVEGPAFDTLCTVGRITHADGAAVLAKVAEALDTLHRSGVVHRDVKSSNILMKAPDHPFLTDFGLAREERSARLTRFGYPIGTLFYMSPEHADGELDRIDARSDVYSLGVVLYEMLTGTVPFRGEKTQEVIEKILNDPPPQIPDAPADLATICLKALEKDPSRRYESARAMADDLNRFARGEAVAARRAGPLVRLLASIRRRPLVAGTAIVTLLMVVVAILAMRSNRPAAATTALAADPATREEYAAFLASLPDERMRRMFAPQEKGELGLTSEMAWHYAMFRGRRLPTYEERRLSPHPVGRWLEQCHDPGAPYEWPRYPDRDGPFAECGVRLAWSTHPNPTPDHPDPGVRAQAVVETELPEATLQALLDDPSLTVRWYAWKKLGARARQTPDVLYFRAFEGDAAAREGLSGVELLWLGDARGLDRVTPDSEQQFVAARFRRLILGER